MSNAVSKIKSILISMSPVECGSDCKKWVYQMLGLKVLIALVATITFVIISYTPLFSSRVKSYVYNHPKEIIDALQKMDQESKEKDAKDAQVKAEELAAKIPAEPDAIIIGNKDAKHTIIEFYDYSCGYCKKMAAELSTLLKRRSDVRVILKDLPILSAGSLVAAKASFYVAHNSPNKVADFHFKLMERKSIDENTIKDVAKSLGISVSGIEAAMSSKEYEEKIRTNYQQANDAKVNGTPVLIIDGKLNVGFLTAQQIIDTLDLSGSDIAATVK
jgi:protein-disulfide isomerase